MQDKLKNVFVSVFGIPAAAITDDSSINNTPNWDSLKHMNLIVALEEEFCVEFDENEFVNMTSYGKIKDILEKKTQ